MAAVLTFCVPLRVPGQLHALYSFDLPAPCGIVLVNGVTVSSAGTCTLTISYVNGDAGRSATEREQGCYSITGTTNSR